MRASAAGVQVARSASCTASRRLAVSGASSQHTSTAVAWPSIAAASRTETGSATSGTRACPDCMAAFLAMARHRSVFAAAFFAVQLHDGAGAGKGNEGRHAYLGGMADDSLHLVALGQALQQNHLRAGLARVFMARNGNEGQLVRKIDDLAFEVILVGVDHRDVLPRRQPEHPRVLRVVGLQGAAGTLPPFRQRALGFPERSAAAT